MPSSSMNQVSAKLYELSWLCAVLKMVLCCWSPGCWSPGESAQSAQSQSVRQQECDKTVSCKMKNETRLLVSESTGQSMVQTPRASFCCSSMFAKLVIYCVYIRLGVWNSWCKLLSELSVSTSSRHCVHNSEFHNCVICILGQNCQFCLLPRNSSKTASSHTVCKTLCDLI